jgi:hypothetical protein
MQKGLLTLATMGLVLAASPLISAQKSTTTTTTTIYDCNGSCNGTNALLMRSDDYNGVGYATYTTVTKGSATAASGFDSNGWDLSLSSASLRTLYLTPNDPVGTQPAAPPAGNYNESLQAHGICKDTNGNPIAFASLGTGIVYGCQLVVEFQQGGMMYKLAMGPNLPWGGPATGVASVVCNKISNNQCVDWTISSATAQVANLYYYVGWTATWVYVGQYYSSFLIHVTNS